MILHFRRIIKCKKGEQWKWLHGMEWHVIGIRNKIKLNYNLSTYTYIKEIIYKITTVDEHGNMGNVHINTMSLDSVITKYIAMYFSPKVLNYSYVVWFFQPVIFELQMYTAFSFQISWKAFLLNFRSNYAPSSGSNDFEWTYGCDRPASIKQNVYLFSFFKLLNFQKKID